MLYYDGMVNVHKRPHDARSYQNLGTLLHEGYKRLWNGQGFEVNSVSLLREMEEDYPIICRDRTGWNFPDTIMHNATGTQYTRARGSNGVAMEASAEAQICLSAATPPVFAALAIGVETGVVRHVAKSFDDNDNAGQDMVCSAMMLTKTADTINGRIKGVEEVVKGHPRYTTGRHFVHRGTIAAVRECGYDGHGVTQVNQDHSTSHIGIRWTSTNSEDASAHFATSNAYLNVTKAILKSVGVENLMERIRSDYLAKYSGTDDEFEQEKVKFAPWAKFLELLQQGSDVHEHESLLRRLGDPTALEEYKALSVLHKPGDDPNLSIPLSRSQYTDRYTDIPPRIAEKLLEDLLRECAEHYLFPWGTAAYGNLAKATSRQQLAPSASNGFYATGRQGLDQSRFFINASRVRDLSAKLEPASV
ncbi:hypothetical protein AB5N19_07055 [Seiridium cardinale]|uniref:Uncharacterized protein n=1 Tax=Seiridium cardinale TaxID=138064 RepID=A0ABR2XLJ0_9PEZI